MTDRERNLARERQRRKRSRDSGGIGVVPVRTHLGSLGELLRREECLPEGSDDDRATLARGILNLLETLRDMRDVTLNEPSLVWRDGRWNLG